MILNEHTSKYIDGLPFVPVTFPHNISDGLFIENFKLDQMVEYINNKNILKTYLNGLPDFQFISNCCGLKHICIEFNLPFSNIKQLPQKGNKFVKEYDLSPLYSIDLLSIDIRNNELPIINSKALIDLSRFSSIEAYYGKYSYAQNLSMCTTLKLLYLNHYNAKETSEFSMLNRLDTLLLNSPLVQSLSFIESLKKLQCLYLHNAKNLQDISALKGVKITLKALRIENCSKITDFSVLSELENLQFLELSGTNKLPNLNFLKTMKNLKTFAFSMNVLDGDLTLCKNLEMAYIIKQRKHYNLRNEDLPKKPPSEMVRGNENIEEWRKLE